MSSKTEDKKRKNNTMVKMVVLIAEILFLHQAFKFINTEGNTHPLLSSLFNMILFLGLIMFLVHRQELEEGKNHLIKQTTLDKYFNGIK